MRIEIAFKNGKVLLTHLADDDGKALMDWFAGTPQTGLTPVDYYTFRTKTWDATLHSCPRDLVIPRSEVICIRTGVSGMMGWSSLVLESSDS